MNWLLKKGIKLQKKWQLAGVEADLHYLENCRKDDLEYNETKARKSLADLKQKEEPTEKEQQKIDELNDKISKSEAAKQEYKRMSDLRDDLISYIALL